MKALFQLRLFVSLVLLFCAENAAKACSPLGTPTLISQSISGTNLILNWQNNTTYTCGYYLQVEFACNTSLFTGTGTPAFYNTATVTGGGSYAYPTQTINISGLCPGTTYKFRARETYPPATYSAWSAIYK